MLKTKLERFIAKRVLIYFIILTIIILVFLKQKWYIQTGLIIGCAFSVIRFGSFVMLFTKIIVGPDSSTKKFTAVKSVLVFFINQLILVSLLFLAYKYDSWFFIGFVASIFLIPFILIINGLTEVTKITHNNFE